MRKVISPKLEVGDRIKLTEWTWGEAVQDKKGKVIHQNPRVYTYIWMITCVVPESSSTSAEVVRFHHTHPPCRF